MKIDSNKITFLFILNFMILLILLLPLFIFSKNYLMLVLDPMMVFLLFLQIRIVKDIEKIKEKLKDSNI